MKEHPLGIIIIVLLLSFSALNVHAQDWYSVNVRTKSWDTDFNDVHFANTQKGWAVGDHGTIIYTLTGVSWHEQISGVDIDLHGVHFSDVEEGWAVGAYGVILHTIDGGITWHIQQSGTNEHLYDVYFINEMQGWAVGARGTILRTEDGGNTWTKEKIGTDDLYSVHFPNVYNGWAVGEGGIILYWNGSRWSYQQSPVSDDLYGVFVIRYESRYDGWAVGKQGIILHNSGPGWIVWKRATSNDLRSIYFPDRQYGWITGDNGTILHTDNYGADWSLQKSSTSSDLNALYAPTINEVWSVGDNGSIVRTANRGASWIVFTNPPYGDFRGVSLVGNRGWVVGDDGVILHTEDGGRTWNEQPSPTYEPLYGVYFLDEDNGWIVGNNGTILRTNDGVTWETSASPAGRKRLRSIHFVDIDSGWAVGDGGTILRWDGADWRVQMSFTVKDLHGVWFPTSSEGYVVGDDGTILYTNDGGKNWTIRYSGTSKSLRGVCFTDAEHGWIVGDGGTVLSKYGDTFRKQNSGAMANLYDVDFVSDTEGWIAGSDRVTLSTRNGGERWELHVTPPANDVLYGIDFIDWSSGIAVGKNGTIARYVSTTPPVEVELIAPYGNVTTLTPTFRWKSSKPEISHMVFIDKDTDPFHDPLYVFTVRNETSFALPKEYALQAGVYYWGIETSDGVRSKPQYLQFSAWPPTKVTLISPVKYISEKTPTFLWDCNNKDIASITYTLFIDDDETPFDGVHVSTGRDTSHKLSSSDPLPSLSEGKYSWGVKAEDPEGIIESPIASFIVDLSPPTGTVEINDGAKFTNSLIVTLKLSASDPLSVGNLMGSGVAEMQISNDGSSWSDPEAFTAEKTWDLSKYGGNTKDGLKTVYILYRDALGHETVVEDEIELDTVPPKGTILIDNGAEFTGSMVVTLSLSATDDRSGVDPGGKMVLSGDGKTWSPPLPYETSRQWDIRVYGGSEKEGLKTLYVKYMDSAGNWMTEYASDDIKLDLTGPTGTILINDGAEFTNSLLVKLTLSAEDESGVSAMQFSNGGNLWSPPEPFKDTRENWDISQYGGDAKDGKKTVYARFIDSVGNVTKPSAEDSITLKSSVSVPTLRILSPKVEGKVKNGDVVQADGKAEPGIELVSKEVLDEIGKPIDIDLSNVAYNAETGQITGSFSLGKLTARTIQLKLVVKDKLGNQADATSNILVVDNEPPANPSISIDREGPTNSTTIGLKISAVDAKEMYLDGDMDQVYGISTGLRNWIPYAETLMVKLKEGDGVKEARVKFRDDVGNESDTVSDRIVLDTTPPTGTVMINGGDELSKDFLVTLTLSASDDSGVENYQASNNGNTWSEVFSYPSSPWELRGWDMRQYGGDTSEGLRTVYVKYKDKAGNWSPTISDSIRVDVTPPSISVQLVGNRQEAMKPVTVTAIIKDNRAITEVNLHYRKKGPREYTTVPMVKLPGDYYTAEIPSSEVTLVGVEYYLSASDGLLTSTNPAKDAPILPHSFTVVDTTPPTIEHEPISEIPVKSSPKIIAKVIDAVKVERVSLFYKSESDRNFIKMEMAEAKPTEYSANIPPLVLPGVIQYYIEAIDSSSNVRFSPIRGANDPYILSFVDIEPPVIVHTPIPDGQEAGNPVIIGANVTDNVGVESVILKYRTAGKKEFVEVKMARIGSYYTAEIPANVVVPGKIDYSIIASDLSKGSDDAVVSHSFTVVDTLPPFISLLTAPSQIEVHKDISISAKVTDNVKVESVTLYYKNVGDTKFSSLTMKGVGNTYSAVIPGQKAVGEVKYYILAMDSGGISSTSPATDPENFPHLISITDPTGPVIQHSPLIAVQEAGLPVTITATVTDDVQVATVSLHYRVAGQDGFKIAPMLETQTKSLYSGSIQGSEVIQPGLEYYIKAIDSSSNVTTHPILDPDKLPHSFRVADTVPPDIAYDPSKLATILITDPIIVTADVTDRVGIKEVKVFYRLEGAVSFNSQVCSDIGGNRFSVTIPSPLREGKIEYYIQAEDNSGNIATSPQKDPEKQPYFLLIEDPFPPLPPTQLTAVSAPGGKIRLTWVLSPSPDTAKYNVYTDNGSGVVNFTAIYDSVDSKQNTWESPVLGDGVYKFVVRAVDASGNEENNTISVSASADSTKPEAVWNLTAESRQGGRIELKWELSRSKDAAVYNVYWDGAQVNIDYSRPLARVNDPGSSWTSDSLRDGVIYRFVVRCEDRAGNEEENTNIVSARADASPPSSVKELASPSHKVGVWSNQPKITVTWLPAEDAISGLAGYGAVWDTYEKTLPNVLNVEDTGKNMLSFEPPDLSQGAVKLYFHIRPVDKAGNWSDSASHLGPFLIDTQPPQPPTNLTSLPQLGGKVKLSWTLSESDDVVKYNIYWDSGTGGGIDYSKPIASVETGNAWTSPALEDGKMYEFSVRAEDRAGNEEKNTSKSAAVADSQPPTITHKPITGLLKQEIMADIPIEANVTDASGLESVQLHYRKYGDERYTDKAMVKVSANLYRGVIPSSAVSSDGLDYYISAVDKAGNVSTFPVTTIAIVTSLKVPLQSDSENEILLGDGSSIYMPVGAVPADTYLTITLPKVIPEPQAGLEGHIATIELSTSEELLKPIRVILHYSDEKVVGIDESKLAMYLWDGQRWNYLQSCVPQENSATVMTTKLGMFSIIGDYEPPTVTDLLPSGYSESHAKVSAFIRDNGSGIDPKSISLWIDGDKVTAPLALKDDHLSFSLAEKLTRGQHYLELAVKDNAGNQASATSTFEVTGELTLKSVYCYPNPFRPAKEANFAYTLTEPANEVTIRIFNMDGKLVRQLVGTAHIGKNIVPWDCRDEAGEPVLNSVYICRIEAEGPRETAVETIKIMGWK